MTTTMSPPTSRPTRRHLGLAILSLAMGGFAIGTTEFAMMGLLKEVEDGLRISTPEAGNLISAYENLGATEKVDELKELQEILSE